MTTPEDFLENFAIAGYVNIRDPYRDVRLPDIKGVHLVYSDDTVQLCGGNLPVGECETTQSLLQATDEAVEISETVPGHGITWHTFAWVTRSCVNCDKVCESAVKHVDGLPTDVKRIAFVEEDPNMQTLQIDTQAYRGAATRDEIEQALDKLDDSSIDPGSYESVAAFNEVAKTIANLVGLPPLVPETEVPPNDNA